MSELREKHDVHKYVRVNPKNPNHSATYRCVRPGCQHYLREEFMVGQVTQCYICEEEFVVTKAIFHPRKIQKIHCIKCNRATYNKKLGKVVKSKVAETIADESIFNLLDDILGEAKR